MKTITRTLFILIILGIVVYGIFYLVNHSTKKVEPLKPAITSLTLEKPNFIIKSRGLANVEVWGIPTGTAVVESSYIKIGIAKVDIVDGKEQRWEIPVPKDPLLLTEIFAKGFDVEGRLVGKAVLPITGASEIYSKIWLEAPQQTLFLKVGESGTMGELTVKVLKVVSDSRCPKDVVCIQAGNVVVELELTLSSKTSKVNVASDEEGKPFEGYFVQVKDVLPETISDTKIPEEEYVITISILKDVKL